MNIQNIFTEIEKVDPEVYDRLDTRRSAMKGFANVSGKIALAAIPLALGSMFTKAYAGTKKANGTLDTAVDILNYALTLEYLESEFYTEGLASGNVPTGNTYNGLAIIAQHEKEHVAFLQATIAALGGTAVTKPNFDFTAGGTFPGVFTSFETFLSVAQTFEDTGVRAYKGRAAELVGDGAY